MIHIIFHFMNKNKIVIILKRALMNLFLIINQKLKLLNLCFQKSKKEK